MAAGTGAALIPCLLLAVWARSAAAFRALKPESAHLQATEAEMRSFLDDSGEADWEVLAAAGVLVLSAAVHWAFGCLRLARCSMAAGAVAALYALRLLDERICALGSIAAVLAAVSTALARARSPPPAKKKVVD